jgi:hypothetical protein
MADPLEFRVFIGAAQLISELLLLPHHAVTAGEVAAMLVARLCFSRAAADRYACVPPTARARCMAVCVNALVDMV